jgi:hypothetical protein
VKARRPPTYQTEKSYYLKQKIKGKMKCNIRVLRRRNPEPTAPAARNKLPAAPAKLPKQTPKLPKKKHRVAKLTKESPKNQGKECQEPPEGFLDAEAEVPPLITGLSLVNSFIFHKLEGLRVR